MIIFKTLTWKNFLSTGNQPTTLNLNVSPTTLVLGANGSGKSTMLDALCYVLFKKPFRKIKKDQILNTINKADCVVEVEFSIGTREYTVRRGIKPDFFEILIDGEIRQKSAGQKDDQEFLEEDILKVNFESFTQVVILGNASYTPFMQLTTPKRREFIEHVLDIGVFSIMNDLLKAKQSTVKTNLDTLAKDITLLQEKDTLISGFIKKLKEDKEKVTQSAQQDIDHQNAIIEENEPVVAEIQENIRRINKDLTDASQRITQACNEKVSRKEAELQEVVAALEAQIVDFSGLENKLRGLIPTKVGIENNLKAVRDSLAFYTENDSCMTCKQKLHDDFRAEVVAAKTVSIQEYQDGLLKIEARLEKLRTDIDTYKKSNRSLEDQIRALESKHNNEVRAMMVASQDEIKDVTGELRKELATETTRLQTHQSAVASARQMIKKLEADMKADMKADNLEQECVKLAENARKLANKEADKQAAIELRHYYEVAGVLLKDTGIKAAIIKQYLPMINKLVNKYLAELDFFLSFALDENFNETFKSRYRDNLQYYSFSEGEKLRIDLSLLFAWRDIARMKNSCATNLLILDEVIDGSMDGNGTDFFIKMINELGEGSNVFVISHKQDSSLDKFRSVIRFEKEKNFSKLAEGN